MTSIFTQNRPYAGLNVADDAKSHVLYFTPLEEVQKSLRVDGTSVVVVTMIGKCSHPKNLLSNLIADQSSFIVRLLRFKNAFSTTGTTFMRYSDAWKVANRLF